ncbi:MAG: SRPBCC domain-containing protein [Gemmatimonadales bacterium]
MPDIRHQVQIGTTPKAIYPLISSAEGFGRWWAADTRQAGGATGSIELALYGRATVLRLRPQTFLAPNQTSWQCETGEEWAGTTITFVVGPDAGGSLLRLTHGGWIAETDRFTAANTTWGALLHRLRAVAEGRVLGPLFTVDALTD